MRTTFFKSNRVRKRRVAMATAAVVGAITAATVFLCIRPAMLPTATAAAMPAESVTPAKSAKSARSVDSTGRGAAVAAEAMASGALVTLADRHARDAARMAEASNDDDLGWDYVQLRL
ncbi:hypothetical protein EHF44_04730 [Cupriavidus pauculus]|uniref:Uncharacterized protein n=2 Tax=Cupriavidus pauculus TaxID=82633 RepID=A0A3G8GXT8_9BURK|nr:hypothetical protein EHF44_04730 [Cupriavidus pauculus]